MSELTFSQLRKANVMRLPTFRNARGDYAHEKLDGSDWTLAQWCNAVTGELGELANMIKKLERGDFELDDGVRSNIGRELADVVTYLDILAFRAGIDLGQATVDKFNEISERVGSPVKIRPGLNDAYIDGPDPFIRGAIVRYDSGTFALFRIDDFSGQGEYLHGVRCTGGRHSADRDRCQPGSLKDLFTWMENSHWREGTGA